MISASFEDLAQSLRVLLEADAKAHRERLILIDRAEAVGNIESALSSVINCFHSLYDAIEKEMDSPPVNWYETPSLATILAIRNAKHHNKAQKIRQLYNFHVHAAPTPQDRRRYVVVDFPANEEGADTFEVFLSWSDLNDYLALPTQENRLRKPTVEAIRSYLASEKFEAHAKTLGVPLDHVFFNVIPLIVNAAISIIPHIQGYIKSTSTEAKTFSILFRDMKPSNTHEHIAAPVTISFPN